MKIQNVVRAKNMLRENTSKDVMCASLVRRVECGPSVNGPVSNCVCVECPGIGRVTTNSKPAYSYVQKLEDAKGGTCQNRGRGGLKTESLDKEAKLPQNKGRGANLDLVLFMK